MILTYLHILYGHDEHWQLPSSMLIVWKEQRECAQAAEEARIKAEQERKNRKKHVRK